MRLPLSIVAFLAMPLPLFGECAPPKLVRIVSQVESPRTGPGSFATAPKTVYRLGATYARVEEDPDRPKGIHALVIVNAPDSWMVNLANGTGRHIVDRDPDGKVSFPLFPLGTFDDSFPMELRQIELGCEQAFFSRRGSPETVLQTSNGDKVKQALGIGAWMLVLLRSRADGPPEDLFVFHGDEIAYRIHYVSYEVLARPDMTLFSPPEGIRFPEDAAR